MHKKYFCVKIVDFCNNFRAKIISFISKIILFNFGSRIHFDQFRPLFIIFFQFSICQNLNFFSDLQFFLIVNFFQFPIYLVVNFFSSFKFFQVSSFNFQYFFFSIFLLSFSNNTLTKTS